MEASVAFQPPPETEQPTLPAPLWRIFLFGGLSLAAGIALARTVGSTHQETYAGSLTVRTVPVAADQAGVVSEWLVAEGDTVGIGQPLVAIANPAIAQRRQELKLEVSRLRAELDRALAKAELELDWRMKDVNETIFAARLQSAEYLEEKHIHEMEKVALTDLLSSDATVFWTQPDTVIDSLVLKEAASNQASRLNTVLRLEAATNASEVCVAQVELCDEQVDWLEDLKETLPERVRKSVGVDVAERNLETAEAEQQELDAAEGSIVIASSAIGRAGVFLKRAGDYASIGEPIVEVLDNSQRSVIVDVPTHRVSEFSIGREVELMFPGEVARRGRVTSVAPQAVRVGESTAAAALIRVQIEQAGSVWPSVPTGVRVDVSL